MLEQSLILIVDDDVDYCSLLQAALEEARVTNPIQIIHDGKAALSYFKDLAAASPSMAGNSCPGLVLLDLRMPGLSGLEVLRFVRCEPRLAGLPVIVLTGIDAGDDSRRAIEIGATSLRVKPFSYGDLVQLAAEIRDDYLHPKPLRHAA